MTMLDRMRRHKWWLKWTLAAVVVAFVLLYVPDFLSQTAPTASLGAAVADVEGRPITVRDFGRAYNAQMQMYQSAYGASLSEDVLRQLGFEQQILNQMIDEEAAAIEAERLGLEATDAEVRQQILALPGLQENGQFIGEQRYRMLLQAQGLTPAQFEENVRRGIVLQKLRTAVTGWLSVSDEDVAEEFRRRNERVRMDVLKFGPDRYRDQVEVDEADARAHYDANPDAYRVGERRRIRYLSLDADRVRSTATVPDADIQAYYDENLDQYSTPEQVRASHILLEIGSEDPSAVRAEAQAILERARAGEDFAELAREYSDDSGSASQGGDLGTFGRGQMVPAFEDAAFSLPDGEISDLVETDFGLHIIKVVEHQQGNTRPFEEVRDQIADELRWERAQEQVSELAEQLRPRIDSPAALDTVAAEQGVEVVEADYFERGDPIEGLGPAPSVADEAFRLAEGQVSAPIQTPQGHVFLTVTGIEPARVRPFDEVAEQARAYATTAAATDLAAAEATRAVERLRAAEDIDQAIGELDIEPETTELLTRGSAIGTLGANPAVEDAAFSLPVGGVSDPIAVGAQHVVLRVLERQDVSDEQISSQSAPLRDELLAARRGQFFASYLEKVKAGLNIRINTDLLAQTVS